MKYIINERQYKLITEEQEILHIPSLEVFGNWNTLQKFLERRGNPLFSIGGDLDLRWTDIETLGNLTSVGGYLALVGCDNLTSLGNLTSVGNNLILLKNQNLNSLGNLTSVGVGFILDECKNLTSLGNLTSVGGELDLSETNIESLGNLTSVGYDLNLRKTPISKKYSEEEIRDMVEVGGRIFL